ncbi:MAG TPA: helix-turn-helix domain-containing protein [Candidatus Dormibacteraeota bacterium]|nr:helix-turn-helix domain-containing protein [Candidatus Dormibacteraeota bacterium]
MTSVVDVWRAVDPEARLISGSAAALGQSVRGVVRTRAAPPHLPPGLDGQLLVADGSLVLGRPLETLLTALREAELRPVAIAIAGLAGAAPDRADDPIPILASVLPTASLTDTAAAYLRDEAAVLQRSSAELRLACAESALAEPEVSAPAGLIAARIRRGVAVSADGNLATLHARPAGRALAARFAALHARLLSGGAAGRAGGARRSNEGLWLLERRIRPEAAVWLFDDLPFAAIDEVAADALTVTLRALLRRPQAPRSAEPPAERTPAERTPALGVGPGDALSETMLAVARANGRVAPAARALGVHRNTVLYRLRRSQLERGLDPRRAEDALRILAEAERRT